MKKKNYFAILGICALAVSTAVSVSAKTIVECSDNFDDFSGTYLAPVGWHLQVRKQI